MEAALEEYVHMCRMLGPWTDWVQGPGGNCSVKVGMPLKDTNCRGPRGGTPLKDTNCRGTAVAERGLRSECTPLMIVKQSGATLADTTHTSGWVTVDVEAALSAMEAGEENLASLEGGNKKPSMEAFLHTLPARIVVHLHPAPLLPLLCDPNCTEIPVAGYTTAVIPYMKPGIPLAKALFKKPGCSIYFLKQHGVVLLGETIEDILQQMIAISDKYFPHDSSTRIPTTPIPVLRALYEALFAETGKRMCVKAWAYRDDIGARFIPYTPDIAVFLQEAPLVLKEDPQLLRDDLEAYRTTHGHPPTVACIGSYPYILTLGNSQDQCLHIYDILLAYLALTQETLTPLSDAEVHALVNWDKEKARKQSATHPV